MPWRMEGRTEGGRTGPLGQSQSRPLDVLGFPPFFLGGGGVQVPRGQSVKVCYFQALAASVLLPLPDLAFGSLGWADHSEMGLMSEVSNARIGAVEESGMLPWDFKMICSVTPICSRILFVFPVWYQKESTTTVDMFRFFFLFFFSFFFFFFLRRA